MDVSFNEDNIALHILLESRRTKEIRACMDTKRSSNKDLDEWSIDNNHYVDGGEGDVDNVAVNIVELERERTNLRDDIQTVPYNGRAGSGVVETQSGQKLSYLDILGGMTEVEADLPLGPFATGIGVEHPIMHE